MLHLLIGPALGVWGGCGDVQLWGDEVEPGEGGREAAREGKKRPWVLLEAARDPRTGIFQTMPTGLIIADFPAGDGKEKIILQSWLTTSLGLFFF